MWKKINDGKKKLCEVEEQEKDEDDDKCAKSIGTISGSLLETKDFLLVYEMLINHIKRDKKSIVLSAENCTWQQWKCVCVFFLFLSSILSSFPIFSLKLVEF